MANVGLGQSAAVRRADYFRDLALTPEPAKEVRIWGLGKWLVGHFEREFQRVMVPLWHERRLGRPIIWLMTLTYAAAQPGRVRAAGVGGHTGQHRPGGAGRVRPGSAGQHCEFRLLRPVMRSWPIPSSPYCRCWSWNDASPTGASAAAAIRPAPGSPHAGIECRGLSFRYPGQSDEVLDRLDLTIPAGQSLAIVGANGAGKTTLIKLLCRLYDPAAGSIVVDGQ